MAVSQIHYRSISLPSRLQGPTNSTGCEAELEKLKSSFSKTSPITSDSIQSGLVALAELYNSLTQTQSLHHEDPKSVEESLESSVELLDSCNLIRELVQTLKESVQVLHSALRRKGLDFVIKNDITSYSCTRKKMNKCISKALRTLKNLENNNLSVAGLTIDIFKCILVFFSSSTGKSSGWSLVSKLMVTKIGKEYQHGAITEVGCVDLALNDVQRSLGRSDSKSGDRQIVEKSLQNLESCVQGIEGCVERLFRQLLRSRVALLNILTDH